MLRTSLKPLVIAGLGVVQLTRAGEAGSSLGVDADDHVVRFAACRFGPHMGFQALEKDPRFPFRFSCS